MRLLELSSKLGKKKRKTIGRGNGSGHGTYSCKGGKGQTARSGGKRRPGFEGGQTPFIRKLPKLKGFKNPTKVIYQIVTTDTLNNALIKGGSIDEVITTLKLKSYLPVKLLLGKKPVEKAITVEVHKASATAVKAIEDKGGKVSLVKAPEKKTDKK